MKKSVYILLVILGLIGCSEPHHELMEVQSVNSQDDSTLENVSTVSVVNNDGADLTVLQEIPKFNKISSIPSNTYDEASKKYISNCGDKAYWDIIKMGESAIPFLISKLNSSTKTTISVPCEEYVLTEGGLAFILIDEIIDIPVFSLFQMQFDVFEMGCNYPDGMLNYMMGNPENTQTKISGWHTQNKKRIKEKKLLEADKSSCEKENNVKSRLRMN